MCGRFNLHSNPATIVQMFLPSMSVDDCPSMPARYNIAPTQPVACIVTDRERCRRIEFYRWGLVPHWADSLTIGSRMINARCETVHEKRSFQKPFERQRCLIPASGYYEWKTGSDGKKLPFHIHPVDGKPFVMAGLWERNTKAAAGAETLTCTILTTASNAATKEVHDRMPVIFDQQAAAEWLEDDTPIDRLRALCMPAPEDWLRCDPANPRVNKVGSEGPDCLRPETLQRGLFDIE